MRHSGIEAREGAFKGSCFSETAVSARWESGAADRAGVQRTSGLLVWGGHAALPPGVPSWAHRHECLFVDRTRDGES